MNTADVIYPSCPMYLYAAPDHLKYLLEPLLRYQESGLYPLKSAVHDIGKHQSSSSPERKLAGFLS